jgi:hypothetical protein
VVRSQPWQIVCETLSLKNPSQKRAGVVAQGKGLSSNASTERKKKSTDITLYLGLDSILENLSQETI